MLKIRIEDTDTNETFEIECEGALISAHDPKECDRVIRSFIIGGFDDKGLKCMRENIKKIIKRALKGEGRIE